MPPLVPLPRPVAGDGDQTPMDLLTMDLLTMRTMTENTKRARGFGPKPKPLRELKLKIVPVRFDAAGLTQLDQLRGEVPRAVWCRDAALQQPPAPPAPQFPEVNRAVWSELARGPMSNMHQIVYRANQIDLAQPGEGWKDVAKAYDELIQIAHQIRAGLLTVIKK